MNRKFSYKDEGSILYLVATPIGNLEDITYRAVRILSSVDVIYAEDTRNSIVLLRHYNIKTPLYSYHEFNKELKSAEIIELLKNGKDVAIISDAGLPVISDPGFNIAKECISNNISVTTIPGACAYVSALVSSGISPMPNTFYGFLDSKKTKRCNQLKEIKKVENTLIFYEAPHRIFETLKDMLEIFGDRHVVIARELTKKFEEYIRGPISQIINDIDHLKGEIVLIVSGCEDIEDVDYIKEVEKLISLGIKSNEAIKEVSNMYNINKKELYSKYLEIKNEVR